MFCVPSLCGLGVRAYNHHHRHEMLRDLQVAELTPFEPQVNPLNAELNPICYLLALLGAHHFLHVSRIRVKLLIFRLLMSYYIWSTHS